MTDVPVHRPTRGRVSKYNPETTPKEAKFLAARGATQAEIAECFGISLSQFMYTPVHLALVTRGFLHTTCTGGFSTRACTHGLKAAAYALAYL